MLGEFLKKIPLPIKDSDSHSYESVADPKLRSYLEGVENIIRGLPKEKWPLSGVAAVGRVSDSLNFDRLYDLYTLYDFVRRNEVIDLIVIESGKGKKSYFLNQDMFRAFNALAWNFKESHGKFAGIVSEARLALGDHPLSQLLREPTPYVKDAKVSEIDFSQGEFWQTPHGQLARELVTSQIIDKKTSFPLRTSQVAVLLRLQFGGGVKIAKLISNRIIDGVDRDNKGYLLELGHVVIAGLALIHLERGYSLEETRKRLLDLLNGTSLQHFIGQKSAIEIHIKDIFNKDSPWLQFPIEPVPPKDPSTVKKPFTSTLRKKANYQEEQIEISADARFKKIPEMNSDELSKLIICNRRKIIELSNRLPNTLDDVNFSTYGLSEVVQVVMFILSADSRRLSGFDPSEDTYAPVAFKRGFSKCLDYMTKYPQLENLAYLFQWVERAVRKNIDKYWDTNSVQ